MAHDNARFPLIIVCREHTVIVTMYMATGEAINEHS